MFAWMAGMLGVHRLPRTGEVTDRAVVLGLAARFTDEVLSELPTVLMPTIRARLRLSLTQVGIAFQALDTVAAVIEPPAGLCIDLWDRRRLLAVGATACALAVIAIGIAPGFGLLVVGFGLYGVGSGPLAHTADVVLIEAHADAVDRISTRATTVDTVGALLAPVMVVVASWIGIDWRVLLVGAGTVTIGYAVALAGTHFPGPRSGDGVDAIHVLRVNVSEVARSPVARLWLLLHALEGLSELPARFAPVWLADHVDLSQGLIGAHVVVELVASLAGLVLLDRLLARFDGAALLRASLVAALVAYPAWLLVGGPTAKFALIVPLSIVRAAVWPLIRGRMLASVPGRAGAVAAAASLIGIVPTTAAFAWLADRIGLTVAMLAVQTGSTLGMLTLLRRTSTSSSQQQP